MRLTTVILIASIMQVSASGFAQKVTYTAKEISLKQLFKEIKKQTGYSVIWGTGTINPDAQLNVNFSDTPLDQVMKISLKDQSATYTLDKKTIVIKEGVPLVSETSKREQLLVNGKILDKFSKPLAGVNITLKNSKNSATSMAEGNYALLANDGSDVVVYSYIGYKTQEIKASDPATKNVVMAEDIGELDQVQILGYSTTTKRLNTGSTYTVKSEELQKNPVPNVLQALQNRVPGVTIVQKTGVRGGAFDVKIRGTNGFNNVDPLYVIDGVVYPAGGVNGNIQGNGLPLIGGVNTGGPIVSGTGIFKGGNALNYINMEDIESVDILKDAAATAIYGSRGAYGVILITTKKGKEGIPTLNLNLERGVEVNGTKRDLLNTADYLAMRREAFKNDGLTPSASDVDVNGVYPEDRYTDFQELYQGLAAATTKFNGRYSGGNNGTNYMISGGYEKARDVQNAKGAIRKGDFKVNFNTKTPNNKLSIDVSAGYSSEVNDMVHFDFSGGGIAIAPNSPLPFLPDGQLNWDLVNNEFDAPMRNSTFKGVTNNLLSSTNLVYKPIKGLLIKATMGYNVLGGTEDLAVPSTVFNPKTSNRNQLTWATSNDWNIRSWTIDPTISYTIQALKKGTLDVTLGTSFGDKKVNRTLIDGRGFSSDALLNNPTTATNVSSRIVVYNERFLGYFGLLNYNWNRKFLVGVSARYDGSTSFGPGSRFGLFGSGSAAYIFSEEKWIKERLSFLSFGKLRASIGTVGGSGIRPFQYLSTYLVQQLSGITVTTPRLLANPDLHWEKNTKKDLGLDLGFFNDRINLSVGVYKNRITDQLGARPLSTVTGFNNVTTNIPAVLENKGFELSFITRNVESKNFSWTTNIVFSQGSDKLVSFPDDLVLPNSAWQVGRSINVVALYNYVGVNPETGLYNFINKAGLQDQFTGFAFLGQPSLNEAVDKTAFVNNSPKFNGSVSNTIRYKSISVGFVFSFVNKMGRNYNGQQFTLPGYFNQNASYTTYNKRWQKPGDITSVPRSTSNALVAFLSQANFRASTGAYERIIYSKLQNVSISYDMPVALAKKLHLKKMSLNLNGQNLLTISKYGTLDPDNMDAGALPSLRVFNLGLNLSL